MGHDLCEVNIAFPPRSQNSQETSDWVFEFSLLHCFNQQVLWASNALDPVIPPWLWQDPGEIHSHQRPADCQRHRLHSQNKGKVFFFFTSSAFMSKVYNNNTDYCGGLVFRVLVRCLKTPSQPGEDAPYQAAVQSEPHLSPGSHSIRPTGILNINPYGSVNINWGTIRFVCYVYKFIN